ncbi:hypothetical protein TNCT_350641 [Trichonephila clavata]|uniref:Uncharacterized protein n=1 Tax=Trichonephila clavata TaxID=2740835 RepID=A0A8X6IMU2_TRICU|nr:hypothetical protein TNCT_350641 [Trichonephila clavata]
MKFKTFFAISVLLAGDGRPPYRASSGREDRRPAKRFIPLWGREGVGNRCSLFVISENDWGATATVWSENSLFLL